MKWEKITDDMKKFMDEICQYCNFLCDCDGCWDIEKGICVNKSDVIECMRDYEEDMRKNGQLCDIENWKDIELFDDETETGGISYDGETLDNFVGECEIDEDITIKELNKELKDCGIKPIKIYIELGDD